MKLRVPIISMVFPIKPVSYAVIESGNEDSIGSRPVELYRLD